MFNAGQIVRMFLPSVGSKAVPPKLLRMVFLASKSNNFAFPLPNQLLNHFRIFNNFLHI